MKTLVVLGHLQVGDQLFKHGEELPPDLLPVEAINLHLDHRQLVEYDSNERRSLYRLFAPFSGAKEQEQLAKEELTAYTLPP
jgi:hypothetical protein